MGSAQERTAWRGWGCPGSCPSCCSHISPFIFISITFVQIKQSGCHQLLLLRPRLHCGTQHLRPPPALGTLRALASGFAAKHISPGEGKTPTLDAAQLRQLLSVVLRGCWRI